MSTKKMPNARKPHNYAILGHSKAVHRKRRGCSDPKLRGLPDGRYRIERMIRSGAESSYGNRYDFDRMSGYVVELGNNRNGSRTTGAGTKWGTGIMLVMMRRVRLRGRSRQDHSYLRLPNG